MAIPRVAIILYTVREAAAVDWRDTLKLVRDCGFRYVQWSGMPDLPAEEIRDGLVQADLVPMAAHCPLEPWEEDFQSQLAFWQTIGVKDIAPGTMAESCRNDRAAFLEEAQRLNHLGARLLDHHIRLSYHNHDWEFDAFDGDRVSKFDLLYANTHVENVNVELDVAWAQAAGENPVAVLRRYPRRCPLVHVKDFVWNRAGDAPEFVPLGQGIVDWDEVFAAAQETCTEWLIYEQDTHKGSVWDNLRASYRFLEHAGLG